MIKQQIFYEVNNAVKEAALKGKLGALDPSLSYGLCAEKTKNPEFGDYSVNVSSLSRFSKKSPPETAKTIIEELKIQDAEVSVIGGFINFKAGVGRLNNALSEIIKKNKEFGQNNFGIGQKVLLEFVSANPTGPLHIGHGRWAAVGSSLMNILKFSGYDVASEFYINDAGNQINNLGRSLWIRVLALLGIDASIPFSEEEGSKNYYPGSYLIDIAEDYLKENELRARELFLSNPDPYNPSESLVREMSDFAKNIILIQQKNLLSKFKTYFDKWLKETALHESGKVEASLEKLKKSGKLYERDNALWFRSSEYGDDQDRVITKQDGSYTYLTADIAYHYDKLERGFERLINIWGADHHGYVPRMKAAIQAGGYDGNSLEVLLGQLVNLIISGEQVRMGKRRKMLTLEELIDEVGVDATRYWMIMRSIDTTLDFDVDLAKSNADENPVFYVQYAHARASGILRTAVSERPDRETGEMSPPIITKEQLDEVFEKLITDSSILDNLWISDDKKENQAAKSLILKLESFEDVVLSAAKMRAPYQIAKYAAELAGEFHRFYAVSRVLNSAEKVTRARLILAQAVKQVLSNALSLLDVCAPESM